MIGTRQRGLVGGGAAGGQGNGQKHSAEAEDMRISGALVLKQDFVRNTGRCPARPCPR